MREHWPPGSVQRPQPEEQSRPRCRARRLRHQVWPLRPTLAPSLLCWQQKPPHPVSAILPVVVTGYSSHLLRCAACPKHLTAQPPSAALESTVGLTATLATTSSRAAESIATQSGLPRSAVPALHKADPSVE
eukprot:gnl/TRDRNA2_/TRDRNA2_162390_c0_seq2.p1 gnl/TRDRNA2_/TRDRNA2_162390_c0~~gnl/TRDRNA2_/TRDRNA2_162390_c0_seq2.p1  ORF type:complete len:132 (+),score=6.40 gnl/TRDRNA2_/TRDRNA2_162390_c0_seq2:125-520(+)